MAIYLFTKDSTETNFYRAADDMNAANHYNVDLSTLQLITENNSENYLDFKLGRKKIISYNGNSIIYENKITEDPRTSIFFLTASDVTEYIREYIVAIDNFLNKNETNPLYNQWNEYKQQLLSFDVTKLTYPSSVSLEEYFYNNNLTVLHPLQLP